MLLIYSCTCTHGCGSKDCRTLPLSRASSIHQGRGKDIRMEIELDRHTRRVDTKEGGKLRGGEN